MNDFFGTDVLKNEEYNRQITEVLKGLFWFLSTNGVIYEPTDGHHLRYSVENDVTKFLSISLDGEILWELKL